MSSENLEMRFLIFGAGRLIQFSSYGSIDAFQATCRVANGNSKYDTRYWKNVGGETRGNFEKSLVVVRAYIHEKMPRPSVTAW